MIRPLGFVLKKFRAVTDVTRSTGSQVLVRRRVTFDLIVIQFDAGFLLQQLVERIIIEFIPLSITKIELENFPSDSGLFLR
jgi:hypothetical protein